MKNTCIVPPTLQEIADQVGKSKNSTDIPPTQPTDTILFHREKYSDEELKNHILQQTNIGRLYVAQHIGEAMEAAEMSEAQ